MAKSLFGKNKDKKPKLESKEEPVINYGTPANEEDYRKALEALQAKADERKSKLVEDFGEELPVFSEEEPQTQEWAGTLESNPLELELEEVRGNYNKLYTRYQALQQKYEELAATPAPEPAPSVDPEIINQLNEVRNQVQNLYNEFQNEAAGRNAQRQIHDVIFLTGQHGLINKFRRLFPFIK